MNKLFGIPVVIIAATCALYYISTHAPKLTNEKDISAIKFPQSLDDLKSLAGTLKQYKSDHIGYVVLLFCFAFLYKQSFAIPGSFMMNILAGAIFGVTRFYHSKAIGFPLVCLLTAIGATSCYSLSNFFAKDYIIKRFSDKIKSIQRQIDQNRDGLFFVLLSLRLFPMSPNWLLNITSPMLNIPLLYFFLSVFIGLMPYNFICVQTGGILSDINNLDDIITLSTMLKLLLVASVAFLPSIFIRKFRNKIKEH